jgi:hypothetical protein
VKRLVVIAVLCALAAGCAARVKYGENSYRVTDDPKEGRLTVRSSLGGSLGSAMWSDEKQAEVRRQYEFVAVKFLLESGRVCAVEDARHVGRSEWEFRYRC